MNNTWNCLIYKFWSPIYDRFFNSGMFLKARKEILAIDLDIKPYTDNLTLDFNQETNGLVLLGNESNCC